MIFKSTRQRLWFVAISVTAFLVVKTYLNDSTSSSPNVVEAVNNKIARTRRSDSTDNLPALISLESIKKTRASNSNEDLFRSKSWYVPPPPPPPAPPPKPVAPPLPFTFLGMSTHPDGSQTLFISDQTRVFLIHGGETLDQNYHVDGIQNGKLVLTYLPLKQKQYLNLVEAQ